MMAVMPVPLVPVVLLLVGGLDDLRQERVSMRYADSHNLLIAGLAHDPTSALSLVHDGAAAAVLVAVEMAGGVLDELLAPVRVYYARRQVMRVNVEEALILRAIANSRGDVALVAELLGVPLREVQRLAARK